MARKRKNSGHRDDELLRELYPKLLAYAAVVASNRVHPDDLLQEALVNTLRTHSLSDLEYPQAYLRRAVLSVELQRQRRERTHQNVVPLLRPDTPRTPTYPSDLGDLEHLDARDRAILYLVHVERCTYAEVAKLVETTEANARLRASRARKKLRVVLADERLADSPSTTAAIEGGS